MNIFICIKCNVPPLNHRNLHGRFWMDLITPILEESFSFEYFGHRKRSDITALLQLCLLASLFLFFDDLSAVAGSNKMCCEMFPLSYEKETFHFATP